MEDLRRHYLGTLFTCTTTGIWVDINLLHPSDGSVDVRICEQGVQVVLLHLEEPPAEEPCLHLQDR